MCVHDRFAIVLGDISNQRKQLHLLLQINRSLVLPCLRVEPPELHRSKCADSLEARIGKVLLRRKVLEPFCELVCRIENKYIGSWLLVDLFPLHGISPCTQNEAWARWAESRPNRGLKGPSATVADFAADCVGGYFAIGRHAARPDPS